MSFLKDNSRRIKSWSPSAGTMTAFVGLLFLFVIYWRVNASSTRHKFEFDNDNSSPITIPQPSETEGVLDILHIDSRLMNRLDTIVVIPGGGSSSNGGLGGGYPEWTRRRVTAAYEYYKQLTPYKKDRTIFLALSAGSLNAPNVMFTDHRVMFECQHVMQHLIQLGVPKMQILGDVFSWDTVTNAWTLRMVVEAVQLYRQAQMSNEETGEQQQVQGKDMICKRPPLQLEIFISDFHADRIRAAFDWVLSLQPSVFISSADDCIIVAGGSKKQAAKRVDLRIHSVDSIGIQWPNEGDYNQRIEHEAAGTQQIMSNARRIRTVNQFFAFLTLGGHRGLYKYLHQDYVVSQGGGW